VLSYAAKMNKTPLEVLADPEVIPDVTRAVRHLKAFSQLMADLATTAQHGCVQDTLEFVVRYSGLVAMWSAGNDDDALENANELVSAGAEYDRQHGDGSGTVTDWLQQISLVSDVDAIDSELGAVTLMTLHAAKGLEFDTVFMVGLEDKLLPHERSQGEHADIEEERRLCFVGMTRAERALTMSFAKWRDFRGMTQRTSKSPFLKELPDEGVKWVTIDEEGGEEIEENDDVPESAVEYMDWRRGQLVRHPDFGIGRVMWIEPRNHRTHAGITFAAYGEKTLILEYAKLQVIDPDEQG
jgi:DNA helicase-2/ATP-dependent DNA helicase PcrA